MIKKKIFHIDHFWDDCIQEEQKQNNPLFKLSSITNNNLHISNNNNNNRSSINNYYKKLCHKIPNLYKEEQNNIKRKKKSKKSIKRSNILYKEGLEHKKLTQSNYDENKMKKEKEELKLCTWKPTLYKPHQSRVFIINNNKNKHERNNTQKVVDITNLKECTFKPKINVEKKRRKNSQNNLKSNISIFDKLYLTDKGKYEKLKKLKEEEEKKEEEKELEFCTFKPKLISQNSLKKSLNSTEKPKGFDEYQKKMREGIIKATEKKYMEKNIGQNYEKIKKQNIQPFNITDLKKNNDKKDFKKNEQFFTIQIKIPNGKERHIKVYLNEDPYDVADNFCKTYCLKNEVKERLAKTILNFRNLYLQKNHIQNKKDDSNSIC